MIFDNEIEEKQVRNEYRALLRACSEIVNSEGKKEIRKAFNFALNAHKDVRRKSGELYIFHPLRVAIIVSKEVGLGRTSIICSLLHDVVEDTEISLEEIEEIFGKKVAKIIDGLTKIQGFIGHTRSMQAENFRRIILTLSEDLRVILIKISDRLHNMRTLDSLQKKKQLKIASETLELFAPLAHRLGLFNIKSELQDLSLKYTEPVIYQDIDLQLKARKKQMSKYTDIFTKPIKESLKKNNLKFEIKARYKSIFSIYKKMQFKGISFEDIHDFFAIRIILFDTNKVEEKTDCWKVYSIVTDFYKPNSDRLRDWISTPKVNGYEALHTTVMGPKGNWVEVQIRTERMNNIAEKGLAIHWKYKNNDSSDSSLDEWIKQVGETIQENDSSAIEFLNEFQSNLFAHEVYAFTPKGELFVMPENSTTLDFAFRIHTEIGINYLGAKINHKLVPNNYKIKNGDQIEIITSKKQKPTVEWLSHVVTAKAKSKIKKSLKKQKEIKAKEGKTILYKKLKLKKIDPSKIEIDFLTNYFQLDSDIEFYYSIGNKTINITDINNAIKVLKAADIKNTKKQFRKAKEKADKIIIGSETSGYIFSKCCNPIPGDDIFAYQLIGNKPEIHRTNCHVGIRLMSNFGNRIIEASWSKKEPLETDFFSVGLNFQGFDNSGLISELVNIISNQLKINMRSISAKTKEGAFSGSVIVDVFDTSHLETLIKNIMKVEGIEYVKRFHVD
ncbi:MAG: RelA/SpoT family protein [Bacteroidota bacterium]|nr:RelA/SpoT family protein [Bacteroidota bacterium]